jgi:hypothetical protein
MTAVGLYWLPLGAGGQFVRLNGRLYDALAARFKRRPPRDLYHSALQIELPEGTYVVESSRHRCTTGAARTVASSRRARSALVGRAAFGSPTAARRCVEQAFVVNTPGVRLAIPQETAFLEVDDYLTEGWELAEIGSRSSLSSHPRPVAPSPCG